MPVGVARDIVDYRVSVRREGHSGDSHRTAGHNLEDSLHSTTHQFKALAFAMCACVCGAEIDLLPLLTSPYSRTVLILIILGCSSAAITLTFLRNPEIDLIFTPEIMLIVVLRFISLAIVQYRWVRVLCWIDIREILGVESFACLADVGQSAVLAVDPRPAFVVRVIILVTDLEMGENGCLLPYMCC